MTTCPVAHDYDPLAPSTARDAYPMLMQMRNDDPEFCLPDLDHYIVTRYNDIERVLLDRDTWSASTVATAPTCTTAAKAIA